MQRAPDLLLAVKEAVDRDTRPGRFLLTGSANVLSNRRVKDALTGRMEIITLWPLSQSEIHGSTNNLVDTLLAAAPPQIDDAVVGRDAFADIVAAGGYPEARNRVGRRRDRWFRDYLDGGQIHSERRQRRGVATDPTQALGARLRASDRQRGLGWVRADDIDSSVGEQTSEGACPASDVEYGTSTELLDDGQIQLEV